MNQQDSLSFSSKVTVAALVGAALGFVIQIAFGVEVPTIPPGLVILLVASGLVAFGPWRWVPVAGVVVGLFLLVGFFASGAIVALLDPGRFGVFIGVCIQFLSVIVAIIAGIAATVQNYRSQTRGEEIG